MEDGTGDGEEETGDGRKGLGMGKKTRDGTGVGKTGLGMRKKGLGMGEMGLGMGKCNRGWGSNLYPLLPSTSFPAISITLHFSSLLKNKLSRSHTQPFNRRNGNFYWPTKNSVLACPPVTT